MSLGLNGWRILRGERVHIWLVISKRECRKFEKGLDNKVKLAMYKKFGKRVEFKKCLHGVCDAGTRLLFQFRLGTHGLNEALGRRRGREGKSECTLCGTECESVVHVLWECTACSSRRSFRSCYETATQSLI